MSHESFQTTYEELKLDGIVEHALYFRFQTTYEELKQDLGTWPLGLQDVASRLPMRNWNRFWGFKDLGTWPRFQTTYEELKRQICTRCPRICCFQTTYEELKLPASPWRPAISWASRLPMRNWNGLSVALLQSECFASRLPMRNWNYTRTVRIKINTRLPDYLWGIETPNLKMLIYLTWKLPDYLWGIETAEYQRHMDQVKLPDYLWGIETVSYEIDFAQLWERFQTTYEELKPPVPVPVTVPCLASRLPMRNWNLQRL